MDNAIYASLSRQSGLMREMRLVANNIANADTTGFRREGVVFAEYLAPMGREDGTLSMGVARGRVVDLDQASLTMTGGTYDLAIEGPGFFMVQTPQGQRLTRAGAFLTDAEGRIVTPDGDAVLDDGQAPITVPPDAKSVSIGSDGTVSADAVPIGRVGVFDVADPAALQHRGGTLFEATTEPVPAEEARVRQGFLEASNVNPVTEIARMIEVQRAYELGQSFLQREDERIRAAITALTR